MNSPYTKAAAWVALIVSLFMGVMVVGHSPSSPFTSSDGSQTSGSIASPSRSTSGTIIPTGFWGGVQIGPQSQVPLIKATVFGVCTLNEAQTPGSMTATSTMPFNCAVPSSFYLQSGDLVQVSLNNGHAATWGSFRVVDATASSTALGFGGIVTVYLSNETGVATSSFPLATTSAMFEINRI